MRLAILLFVLLPGFGRVDNLRAENVARSVATLRPTAPVTRDAADLHALLRTVTREENAYRAAHGRFTAAPGELRINPPRGVQLWLRAEGAAGFSAVALSAGEECAVYHGAAAAPRGFARTEGRIACRRRR
jgi:hypothetical protein